MALELGKNSNAQINLLPSLTNQGHTAVAEDEYTVQTLFDFEIYTKRYASA